MITKTDRQTGSAPYYLNNSNTSCDMARESDITVSENSYMTIISKHVIIQNEIKIEEPIQRDEPQTIEPQVVIR